MNHIFVKWTMAKAEKTLNPSDYVTLLFYAYYIIIKCILNVGFQIKLKAIKVLIF